MNNTRIWYLDECEGIGGVHAMPEEIPFSRSAVVLRKRGTPHAVLGSELYLLATRGCTKDPVGPGWEANGVEVHADEWRAACLAEKGFALEVPIRIERSGTLWLFGCTFPDRDAAIVELKQDYGVLAGGTATFGTIEVLLVDDRHPHAHRMRDGWNERFYIKARDLIRQGDTENALLYAEAAFHLDRGLTESRMALLVRLFKLRGRNDVAEGFLAMSANTKGDEFARRVRELSEEV